MLEIRVDDFVGTKPEEFYRHNVDNFVKFNEVMRSFDLTYTLGIIPSTLGRDEINYLWEQRNDITYALHGLIHDEHKMNEFEGKKFPEIENLLKIPKLFMDTSLDTNICDYIPPHNVFDEDTVIALHRLGFERIFGGPGTMETLLPFVESLSIEYVHSEFPYEYGRTDELLERKSIEHIMKKLSHGEHVCLTLHWTWEWNIGLDYMKRYFDKLIASI